MIEDRAEKRHVGEPGADLRPFLGVGHRRMGALGDQRVELAGAARLQLLRHHREQQVGVVVPRLVRDDRQHARPGRDRAHRVTHRLPQVSGRRARAPAPGRSRGSRAVPQPDRLEPRREQVDDGQRDQVATCRRR